MIHNRIDKRIASFHYKCLVPLYVNQPIQLCAKNNDVWITNHHGHLAVKGSVTFGDT
jgi:3-methylfumaryl-CoA hydratase